MNGIKTLSIEPRNTAYSIQTRFKKVDEHFLIQEHAKMIQNYHPYGSISKRKKRETITFEA